MVEDMLSDREQARRKMFEQAAGVSKYKARKHETQQKLEATAADLDRVEDLLFEITDQLKKLEKQAERAKKYYELKNEYKTISVELAVHNLARHKSSYKELESQIAREEDNYRSTEAMTRLLEADVEAKRKSHTDKETSLSEQQQETNRLTGRIRGKENEKAMLEQKRSFIKNDVSRLTDQIQQNTQVLKSLEFEIEGYTTDLNYERNLEAAFEDSLEEAQKNLEAVRSSHNLLKGNLDEFVKEQQLLEREINELEKTKAIQHNQIDNLRRDVERTLRDIATRREEMKILEKNLENTNTVEQALTSKINALELSESKRKVDITTAENQQEILVKKLADHNRTLDARRNEHKLTKSMVESLEGFPESIKFLSQDKDWAKRCPLLSDLVFVKEEYRIAIENYLENYLNYYVVPNVEEAVKAIGLLGQSQKGRANFFILDAFQNYMAPLALLPGGQSAVDLVEVEKQYRPLMEFLLERVVVTEDTNLMAEKGSDVIILSKSGTFVKRKFSLSGGSVGLFEGKKIGRKKNLEILETEIKQFEDTEAQLNTQLGILRAHVLSLKSADQTALLQQERGTHNRLSQEKAGMQAKLDNIAAFVANFDAQAGDANQRISHLTESNGLIENQLKAKNSAAEAIRDRLTNADGSFRNVAEQLSLASSTFNQKNIEFIRQQNKVNTFRQELTFREKRRDDLRQGLSTAQTTLAKNTDETELLDTEIQQILTDLKTAYADKKQKEATLSGVEQAYFKARNEIHELENKQRDNFRKQQELQGLVNRLKEKFSDVKFEITSIGERLRAEFGLGVNDVINQEPNTQYNRDALEKDVNSLKRKLDNYGEINPMAIEAYNEIKDRHDTIAGQRDDINNAKENLLQTMKEIEETATARFLESFAQVRENFIKVFRTLFTEDDSADLLLTNPNNPLDSDINIIAKPKGKRPQTIAQLSGGEKTLTATALLFALYLLKPAPFCIFDEVDAPLDDANIEKFNRIIRQFSADSQFIVVTHNKATMAAVDTIYGVYMPEQGVSAVTLVDFRQLGHEALVFEAS
jgi:chromosome segregation protein